MSAGLYTQRPIVIEAMQVTGEPEMDREISSWLSKSLTHLSAEDWSFPVNSFHFDDIHQLWQLSTSRRLFHAAIGDWIVKTGEADWATYTNDEFTARFQPLGDHAHV